MKMKTEQRRIYKIHSAMLKKSKWNLQMPLEKAMKDYPDIIVTLSDSQLMRWIDSINGIEDVSGQIQELKIAIGQEKSKKPTTKTRRKIRELYKFLYELQFQKDYIAVIMDSVKDYDRANEGFQINGISYRRLYGTSNGVKHRTIIYVNAAIYDEIKKRIDNGRNKDIPLVPGKLEAYQALTASGSVPIPQPEGIIVVPDCITHFKEDIIRISDENGGEPELTFENNVDIEHNDSDGYGLMLPSYSRRVNEFLTGDDSVLSGMNTRYAFEKGMVYSFDYIEFAEKIAGTYEITDVWGDKRDVRNAEVILTASQVKLWDSYKSWEDYYSNCQENGYQFSSPKITPASLENVRTLNYQFINPYSFTETDLQELCRPTIDTIKDVLGGDYRKGIVYLAGAGLSAKNVLKVDDYLLALMIAPEMIKDPYIKRTIHNNIKKRIDDAKKGTITVNGNYLMISGDPYALAQSIFNLPITGLLKAGEIYQKYWNDKGAKELVCFRAPMTCFNNIRKMQLNNTDEAAHWYQYITTALLYNAWDSACDAMNGQDKDGDTNLITNNPVLLANTENAKTIFCIQKKAEKKIVQEADLIESNKIAFNDDIGAITNRATAMFDLRSRYAADSEEYNILTYRIMCTQHYQQCSIDRIKGVISLPMPEYWYHYSDGVKDEYKPITADRKPYFLIYRYPDLRKEYNNYIRDCNSKSRMLFRRDIPAIKAITNPSDDIKEFLYYYEKHMPVTMDDCTVNRICRMIESEFDGMKISDKTSFDYKILKSGVGYSANMFNQIKEVYQEYKRRITDFMTEARQTALDKDDVDIQKQELKDYFIMRCSCICPDVDMLSDIVIDLCYTHENSKSFAWDIAGHTIIKNLLKKHDNIITYPALTNDSGDFTYLGNVYKMERMRIE